MLIRIGNTFIGVGLIDNARWDGKVLTIETTRRQFTFEGDEAIELLASLTSNSDEDIEPESTDMDRQAFKRAWALAQEKGDYRVNKSNTPG